MVIEPFQIDVPAATLDRIKTRLGDAVWPDIPTGEPWAYGASEPALRELVDHWLRRYDWAQRQAAMNRWPQFKAQVDGYEIHFIHVRGAGSNPRPLLINHGWPGSFVEFLEVIDGLTHPERHGGNIDDAWSVVIPSLPGFGFSSKPARPIGPREIARLFDKLMREGLGYERYVSQGGDWGSSVSGWLGYEGAGCVATHINFTMGWNPPDIVPENDAEFAAAANVGKVWQTESGYVAIQSTKPLTLSYAMQDSPLGVAAWIFEKFRGWSQLERGDLWSVYSRDAIIDNLMVYLVTGTFGTAAWLYRGVLDEPVPAGAKVTKPVAIAHFPGELIFHPRSQMERIYNVVRWSELSKGGHFAAMEQPRLFTEELWGYNAQLRGEGLV